MCIVHSTLRDATTPYTNRCMALGTVYKHRLRFFIMQVKKSFKSRVEI